MYGCKWDRGQYLNQVIAYYSRGIRNAECLAIVESIKRFRHYFLGRRFVILTTFGVVRKQKSIGWLWSWALCYNNIIL